MVIVIVVGDDGRMMRGELLDVPSYPLVLHQVDEALCWCILCTLGLYSVVALHPVTKVYDQI